MGNILVIWVMRLLYGKYIGNWSCVNDMGNILVIWVMRVLYWEYVGNVGHAYIIWLIICD